MGLGHRSPVDGKRLTKQRKKQMQIKKTEANGVAYTIAVETEDGLADAIKSLVDIAVLPELKNVTIERLTKGDTLIDFTTPHTKFYIGCNADQYIIYAEAYHRIITCFASERELWDLVKRIDLASELYANLKEVK